MSPRPGAPVRGVYLDACATAPPAPEVLEAMAAVQAVAWGNPSSLHGHGLAAAEALERARWRCAALLGCRPEELVFTSGGSESIHLALLGAAENLRPGRLLISSVEHPATAAAAAALERRGWQLQTLPVDREGLLDLEALERWVEPPTRLVSLIWGQSEVGSLQPLDAVGARCRRAGVLLHVDAVQVVGHLPVDFAALPVDLLSLAGHKLQGPRGIGALLVRSGVPLTGQIGGGGQEAGRRSGTEPVALAAGLCRALELADERLRQGAGRDPVAAMRDALLARLLELPGLRLSGPDPRHVPEARLPHHLSLLVSSAAGGPFSGRQLVRRLWQEGYAVSSGSACSSGGSPASPVLRALGYGEQEAASGLRLGFGPWLSPADLEGLPDALERARQQVAVGP
ncbi:cysteine desulfurase family protein [Cyanobium sp. CH-040]|uniref:cysteine desulfurase family protein n=1 Tax=Cyanobium sp. CH-040 TaxID=2823708 RepID=UPI0020CC4E66|nr:cysteine desulfurase family protein [Cyanobium sp. CH-040]MCP9927014.1 cysteine desulfurase [Cyanobium sp. CH-040]